MCRYFMLMWMVVVNFSVALAQPLGNISEEEA